MEIPFKIHFLGGAGTVTGSKTLIEIANKKFLIDCGLFQGLKQLRMLNRAEFPVNPADLDAVIITHAHLDHCGYIPILVKNGFKGRIHCTTPSYELAEIILKDSGKIQEEDANRANKYQYTKHEVAKPLYTQAEAELSLPFFKTHGLEEWIILDKDVKFQFLNSGHILGSAMVDLRIGSKKVIFSGDIGRANPMLLYPPKKVDHADYIIMESTYGDRIHENGNVKEEFLAIIEQVYANRGILMIPSFAIERTQELIYLLYQLKEEGRLPNIPAYLDSPMGVNSSYVFNNYPTWQNLPKEHLEHMFDSVKFIKSYDQSKEVVADHSAKIVLAGSGMIEGGRILHYLNNHLTNPNNVLLFVGFQAVGTRGRAILRGETEIKFFGTYHRVDCQIKSLSSMSAHADQVEIIDWLKHLKNQPAKLFLNHGEPHQSNQLRVKIEQEFGWECEIPSQDTCYEL